MFSYRHAFHAGNHGDVLKHTVLVAALQYLTRKETALCVIDTHAGAGIYRLDGDCAQTSGEAHHGVQQILAVPEAELAPALRDYVQALRHWNRAAGRGAGASAMQVYPGSPFIAQALLRPHDRLHLCELLPADARALQGNIAQLDAGRQVRVMMEDGFAAPKKLLPPPSRRALVLCDPSYEIKSDYQQVPRVVEDALQRFATGAYLVWYPLLARPDAHELPRRLQAIAARAGRPWLHAMLTVKSARTRTLPDGSVQRPGMPGSGMFVINPPFTLCEALKGALPQMAQLLAQDDHASYRLEAGG